MNLSFTLQMNFASLSLCYSIAEDFCLGPCLMEKP